MSCICVSTEAAPSCILASTFNEMRDKIDRRAAAAEAKMQLGAASVDTQMQDIEREAIDMQSQDKLLEYKRAMGLLPSSTSGATPQGALPSADDYDVNNYNQQVLLKGGTGRE